MSSILDQFALADHIRQATTAGRLTAIYTALNAAGMAVTLPNPVRHGTVVDYEQQDWPGPYPFIEVVELRREVGAQTNNPRMVGSAGAAMAQSFANPNTHAVRIRSQSDTDNGFTMVHAQRELLVLSEAIEDWFSVIAHRCLPDSGGHARVKYAGPPFKWAVNQLGVYQLDDGVLEQVRGCTLTVLGLPRAVTP